MSEELVGPEIFGDDYLGFYEEMLEERSDSEVELMLRLLDLADGAEILDAPAGMPGSQTGWRRAGSG